MFSNRSVYITNKGRMGRHGVVCEDWGWYVNRFVSRVTNAIEDLDMDTVSRWNGRLSRRSLRSHWEALRRCGNVRLWINKFKMFEENEKNENHELSITVCLSQRMVEWPTIRGRVSGQ